MIILENKTDTSTTSSPLNLLPKGEGSESTVSFSDLLRGASTKKDDKVIQNGALILALDEKPSIDTADKISIKGASLLELLKGEQKGEAKLPLELNPEVTKNLTPLEVKVLIKDAKEYLKNKIIASEGFKKVEIEALPKTLKGLVAVAKKFNIDINKITLESVQVQSKTTSPTVDRVVQQSISDTQKKETKRPIETVRVQNTQSKVPEPQIDVNKTLPKEVTQTLKETPLFKVASRSEITTQQFVATKQKSTEQEPPKQTTQSSLKSLLRDEVTPSVAPKELKVTAPTQENVKVSVAPKELKVTAPIQENVKESPKENVKVSVAPKELKVTAPIQENVKVSVAPKELKVTAPIQKNVKESPKENVKVSVAPKELKVTAPIQENVKESPKENVKVSVAPKELKVTAPIQENVKESPKENVKVSVAPKELKVTAPIVPSEFKAQTATEIATVVRENRVEVNKPKEKAENTLKMLLRGEKVLTKESGFTADFSVATARVLASQVTTTPSKTFESLLRGEQNDTNNASNISKMDGGVMAKVNELDVKLHEAKQMTKYLSQDVKTAIEDYKSPFTRVKVALNPQKLGSIELTVVQRGKNLHINLSSNNAAINTLALNAQELKVQLTNSGINNASLNFNNNSESSEQSGFGQQQQNSHNREKASKEYSYLQSEEQNEEIINSLEIVVPHYA